MKALTYVGAFLFFLAFYLLFSGSVSLYDITVGCVASAILTVLYARIMYGRDLKPSDIAKVGRLIKYFFWYMFVAEPKAHADVIKRALSPSMPINPGIVEVPFDVKSDFSITLIAGSITNTPGTVTVEVDKERKVLYVHWIDVKVTEPEAVREHVSRDFEKHASRIWG